MPALFIVYVLIGPAAWGLLLFGMTMGNRRMNKLERFGEQVLPEPVPTLCVVVPAKDEAGHVRRTLDSVLAMDYPAGAMRVIAVNDRSDDETGAILDELAEADERVTAVHVGTLPDGWLGKCHALHVATDGGAGVDADWLLFVDSDVIVEPAAARTAVGVSVARTYDAVSLLSRVEPQSFVERWLVPVCGATWATLGLISRTNEGKSRVAAANGQFFLVRRVAYVDVGGHEAVKDRITEDVALMRLLKRRLHIVKLFHGGHLVSTRMHATWRQVRHGWARIYTGTTEGRLWPIVIAATLAATAVLPLGLVWLGEGWTVAAGLHGAFVLVWLAFVYRGNRSSPGLALLAPATLVAMTVVLLNAVRRGLTGTVDWRGSAVTQRRG